MICTTIRSVHTGRRKSANACTFPERPGSKNFYIETIEMSAGTYPELETGKWYRVMYTPHLSHRPEFRGRPDSMPFIIGKYRRRTAGSIDDYYEFGEPVFFARTDHTFLRETRRQQIPVGSQTYRIEPLEVPEGENPETWEPTFWGGRRKTLRRRKSRRSKKGSRKP